VIGHHIETIELMLSAGADVNTPDSSGCTPLSSIVNNSVRNFEKTQMIPDEVMATIHLLVMAGTKLNINR